MKSSDGLYHIGGKTYQHLNGSRAQIMHGTAYKTTGGLTKKGLKYNKHGKIVSTRKSSSNPLKHLTRAGYKTVKGQFGWVRDGAKGMKKHKSRKHKSRKHKSRKHKSRGIFLHERRGVHGRYRKLP